MTGISPTAKIFAVLEVIAERGSCRLTDISKEIGVSNTTLHHTISQMENEGLLQRELGGRQLKVGAKLARLATGLVRCSMRDAPVRGILEMLANNTGESCSIGVRSANHVVYLEDVTSDSPLAYNFQTGRRSPLYCTSTGKLYLSTLTKSELNQYIKNEHFEQHTPSTITDPNLLRKEVASIAFNGFATSNGEFVQGVVGAAVPIKDPKGNLIAGLAVSAPVTRISFEKISDQKSKLMRAAKQIADTFL